MLAHLTSANAEALLSFSISRYRESGYEMPRVVTTAIATDQLVYQYWLESYDLPTTNCRENTYCPTLLCAKPGKIALKTSDEPGSALDCQPSMDRTLTRYRISEDDCKSTHATECERELKERDDSPAREAKAGFHDVDIRLLAGELGIEDHAARFDGKLRFQDGGGYFLQPDRPVCDYSQHHQKEYTCEKARFTHSIRETLPSISGPADTALANDLAYR